MKKLLIAGIILLSVGCNKSGETCFAAPQNTHKSGEYAYINVKDSVEAFNALSNSGMRPSYREHLAQNILKNPGIYNPVALLGLGIQCLRYDDYFYGALYTRAALLRAQIDIRLSQDPSLASIPEEMLSQVHKALPNLDREKLNLAWERITHDVIAWDKGTPRNYDRRWASLRSSKQDAPLQYVALSEEYKVVESAYNAMLKQKLR